MNSNLLKPNCWAMNLAEVFAVSAYFRHLTVVVDANDDDDADDDEGDDVVEWAKTFPSRKMELERPFRNKSIMDDSNKEGGECIWKKKNLRLEICLLGMLKTKSLRIMADLLNLNVD